MQLFQDTLNKARRTLQATRPAYTPPYHLDRHTKPSGAAQDAVCGDCMDANGAPLGHPKLKVQSQCMRKPKFYFQTRINISQLPIISECALMLRSNLSFLRSERTVPPRLVFRVRRD